MPCIRRAFCLFVAIIFFASVPCRARQDRHVPAIIEIDRPLLPPPGAYDFSHTNEPVILHRGADSTRIIQFSGAAPNYTSATGLNVRLFPIPFWLRTAIFSQLDTSSTRFRLRGHTVVLDFSVSQIDVQFVPRLLFAAWDLKFGLLHKRPLNRRLWLQNAAHLRFSDDYSFYFKPRSGVGIQISDRLSALVMIEANARPEADSPQSMTPFAASAEFKYVHRAAMTWVFKPEVQTRPWFFALRAATPFSFVW